MNNQMFEAFLFLNISALNKCFEHKLEVFTFPKHKCSECKRFEHELEAFTFQTYAPNEHE